MSSLTIAYRVLNIGLSIIYVACPAVNATVKITTEVNKDVAELSTVIVAKVAIKVVCTLYGDRAFQPVTDFLSRRIQCQFAKCIKTGIVWSVRIR